MVSVEPLYVSTIPLSPASNARLPVGLNAIARIALAGGGMLVLMAAIPVPLNCNSVLLSPPISAYTPFGFHADASKSNVVPLANDRTVVPSYVSASPLLPTKSAILPLGFQLVERMVAEVLGM